MSYIKLPYFWILDPNPEVNAKILTDKDLASTMYKLIDILVCVHLFQQGLRNKNIIYWYIKNDKDAFLTKYFTNFPKFKVFKFDSIRKFKKGIKWIVTCKQNYDLIILYLLAIINEYNYRFEKNKHIKEIRDIAIAFIEYSLVNNVSKCPSPIESLLIKFKIPVQYMKNNRIDSLKYWYSSIYKHYDLFTVYTKDIPEIMLKNNEKTICT